ncbi:PAS sensor protein [Streptomyces sp. RKND-216]|uniref:SpoIIE family protein phosphatase n=1 Tax=Streptomyces sp. RKND-216 TaxID=2562581 RepID=UPI00109E3425|nr:SpoIIE family protein phosphatase [Streptomyces sp. RKND-216]THA26676.1 PAS sensor protein [Streptomyces sp. RKND-216]
MPDAGGRTRPGPESSRVDPEPRDALASAGATLAVVYLLDPADGMLRAAGSVGGAPEEHGLPAACPAAESSPVADAFRAGHPLWPMSAYPEPARLSLAVLPLGGASGPFGCLAVVENGGEGFCAERRALLEMYADHVAAWLEAAGAGRGDIAESARAAAALEDLRVGTFTLHLGTGRIDADPCALELVDLDPEEFDARLETLLAYTVPDDLPALMTVVKPDPTSYGRGRDLEFRVRRPSGELRWLRLRARVLPDEEGGPGGDGGRERLLGVVADSSFLRPGGDDVSRLQQLSAALATAVTVGDVSHAVVDSLREPLGAARVALAELAGDRLAVVGLDPPGPGGWPEGWHAGSPGTPARVLPTLDAALSEGRASLWEPGTVQEPALAGVGPGGLAVLPLPADGQVVGACFVGWDAPHAFGAEERSLLTATAGLVGQALKRAHALDAEHELATTLQRSLLPRRLPDLPGALAVARYLPSMMGLEVGGDWYDVIPLAEGRVALVIGDVQGHSAAAATLMGQLRTAIRAYAAEGHPADIVVSHTNRLLVSMETDLFATCTYVELDLEEGHAWVVRAGHIPPVLRLPEGGTEEVASEGGPPLGVLPDAEYPLTTLGLAPGTVLALLTDGLVESKRLDLDEGMGRVRDLLAAADPAAAERMADDVVGGVTRREDDAALLLLRFDGMASRPIRAGWSVWRLPDAVLHARRFTARTLRSWGLADEADVALLVVSELVTNALLHTQGAARLDLMLSGDRLRVAVTDSSPRAPAKPVIVDWEATGGRGILLVEAVSTAWGSVPVGGGKQVWAEVPVPPREPGEGDRLAGPPAEAW